MLSTRLLESATRIAETLDGVRPNNDRLIDAIRALGELRRLADAVGVRLTAELDARSANGGPDSPDRIRGYVGAASLVAGEAGIDRREALDWSAIAGATADRTSLTGEPLPPHRPLLAEAMAAGEVGVTGAARIVRALDDAAAHASAEQVDEFERILVACAPRLSERELRSACRRIADLVDPDGAEPREDELRRRTTLTIRQQDDGMTRITALLHPQAAGYLTMALDARTAPRRLPTFAPEEEGLETPEGTDLRPLGTRRAEALSDIARESLAHDSGQVAGAPVGLLVSVGLDQLRSGLGTAQILGIDEPISAATARRMASDAAIIPIVLGSESEILDQGTAVRLATPAQRRALAHRDRGCIWGGCTAPPGWCEVAHIVAWVIGGRTDLDNLALMCPFHHRQFDRSGWGLRWRDGVPWLIPPPHIDPSRTPRRAGPARLTA